MTPGLSAVVTGFACPAGHAVSYEISSGSGSSLSYFQDYNPSPIGLYISLSARYPALRFVVWLGLRWGYGFDEV